MNNKQLLTIFGLLSFTIAGIALFAGSVSAHFGGMMSDDMLEKVSEKTGKSTEELGSIFQSMQELRQEERQARMSEKLDEAVSNGTITEEQKQLLVDKHEEHRAEREPARENGQQLTQEEREAQREEHRSEFEAWASANGIDLEALDLGQGEGSQGMRKGKGMHATN